MKGELLHLRMFYKHVVPFAVAIRLVTLTNASSLAIAATHLPAVDGRIAIGTLLPEAPLTSAINPEDFLNETNSARVAAGLPPLQLNQELSSAAAAKAQDMVTLGYWDHFRPSDQKAPWDFITEAGYHYHYAGENLARGFKTAHGITEAWLASPSHRANLLSTHYTEVGFASQVETTSNGEKILLSVQLFGAP
jgi:uncharacterized protein YkwD